MCVCVCVYLLGAVNLYPSFPPVRYLIGLRLSTLLQLGMDMLLLMAHKMYVEIMQFTFG